MATARVPQPTADDLVWFRQGLFAPVTEEVTALDLPVTGRIPSELNGRYLRNGPNFMRGIDDRKNLLLKHDIEDGAVEEHRFEHGAAGEAVFAPKSLSAGEDEGYIMAYAHDLDGGRTDLVILAAQDFAGEPVARIHLPVRVPLGFHGSWIADS